MASEVIQGPVQLSRARMKEDQRRSAKSVGEILLEIVLCTSVLSPGAAIALRLAYAPWVFYFRNADKDRNPGGRPSRSSASAEYRKRRDRLTLQSRPSTPDSAYQCCGYIFPGRSTGSLAL